MMSNFISVVRFYSNANKMFAAIYVTSDIDVYTTDARIYYLTKEKKAQNDKSFNCNREELNVNLDSNCIL